MLTSRKVIITEDGSPTLYVPALNEHYHSIHGAIQESKHIFIQAGIQYYGKSDIYILEAGFGTGLNALLTLQEAHEHTRKIIFHSIEKYPLSMDEVALLNNTNSLTQETSRLFYQLHQTPWNQTCPITPCFTLHKHHADFATINFPPIFDIIFFDAFSPEVQPHLWQKTILSKFHNALKPGGILLTYCVKGIVKRTLKGIGFQLERLPGPPGKREILRATKTT